MGMKLGLIIGFGAGYYLGSRAGRERYDQINAWVAKVRESEAATSALDRARGLMDEHEVGGAEFVGLDADVNPN